MLVIGVARLTRHFVDALVNNLELLTCRVDIEIKIQRLSTLRVPHIGAGIVQRAGLANPIVHPRTIQRLRSSSPVGGP